ncbi:hypothetical protein WJX81_007326 [Elliptochloris bilobata]|uniref:prolycopene isomerase n=1 Tax=Elliptochloris bilobata TaxID=381761 RepID=A0AAW1R0H4_9CHLO
MVGHALHEIGSYHQLRRQEQQRRLSHLAASSSAPCRLLHSDTLQARHACCRAGRRELRRAARAAAAAAVSAPEREAAEAAASIGSAPTDVVYDAVVVGGGVGGLAAATQLAAKGASVVVLEKYIIPGGSAGHFQRDGYVLDVGASMMFGMGDHGTTNLITRALAAVGKRLETVPDPTSVFYHLPASEAHPQGLEVKVWRGYEDFVDELAARFPAERKGIEAFYGEAWRVFNALNSLELKSLEEPRYLLGEFAKHPLACLTLASYLPSNAGAVARKYIKDPELLRFIDVECYFWSTVLADSTPMMNAGMVFCDRHYGGINYPVGGVGRIAEELAEGLRERGGHIEYRANVREVIVEGEGPAACATGVRLADGRVFRGRAVVSNATRWDTFDGLLPPERLPEPERLFRQRYTKAPSFLSIHMGVEAHALAPGTECHHICVDAWEDMESPLGTVFVSIPTLLDPGLAPPGAHIVHIFTPDWIDNWKGLSVAEYERKKVEVADGIVARLERHLPGLKAATLFREVGTPRTHRRFLNRRDGSYGPIPSRRPLGMLGMPFNRTALKGLYCVGDSTFPGQGVNAVVFSGFGCAHRVLCDLGKAPSLPGLDAGYNALLGAVRDRV